MVGKRTTYSRRRVKSTFTIQKVIWLWFVACFMACQQPAPKTSNTPASTTQDSNPCVFESLHLAENRKTLSQIGQTIAIVADSSSYDEKMGDSHRILVVKEQTSCKDVFRQVLPVNQSPDFPYYFANINYNNANSLVAIKGFNKVFCYDIRQRRILPALIPQFKNTRENKDAQSGMIIHLELWENYLIGYAKDNGTFAFEIQANDSIKAVLPIAEYRLPNTDDYHSLFALRSDYQKTQLLIPQYNIAQQQFSLSPLFDEPIDFDITKSQLTPNQQHLLFLPPNATQPIIIDLKTRRQKNLSSKRLTTNIQAIMRTLSESE